jgi:4-aminobutyrate aminotransferase-like enzyme
VREEGFRNGIFFGVGGAAKNVLKIKPPLIITPEEADTVLERFHASLKSALCLL